MSKNEMISMIETMNNYDDLASKAKAKADAIREAIKEEMVRQNTEELVAGAYIVRFTNVISNRFDSTTFKRLYADLYKDFTKPPLLRILLIRKTLHGPHKARGAIQKGDRLNEPRIRKMLHQREQAGHRPPSAGIEAGRGGEHLFRIRTRGRCREVSVVLSSGTGTAGRHDYYFGSLPPRQKHKAVV